MLEHGALCHWVRTVPLEAPLFPGAPLGLDQSLGCVPLLKVWSLDQQQHHCLGAHWKCSLGSQPWTYGISICIITQFPDGSYTHANASSVTGEYVTFPPNPTDCKMLMESWRQLSSDGPFLFSCLHLRVTKFSALSSSDSLLHADCRSSLNPGSQVKVVTRYVQSQQSLGTPVIGRSCRPRSRGNKLERDQISAWGAGGPFAMKSLCWEHKAWAEHRKNQ